MSYKPARFHFFDVFTEDCLGFRTSPFRQSHGRTSPFRQSHGLLNDHESPGQQSQPRESLSTNFKLLSYACGNINVLFDKDIHNGRRGCRSDNLSMLQFPGKEKIIGAAFAHDNPILRVVHFLV